MKKVIVLGKIDYNGTGRKVNAVQVEINLKDGKFSMSAGVWNAVRSDFVACGQMCDELPKLFPNNKPLRDLVDLWKDWHLNDMHAGTEAQEACIKAEHPEVEYESGAQKLCAHKQIEELKRLYKTSPIFNQEYKDYAFESYNIGHISGDPDCKENLTFEQWVEKDINSFVDNNFSITKSINDAKEFLKDTFLNKKWAILRHHHLLYDAHPVTGEPYKYGTAWLTWPLPDWFESKLNELIAQLESQNK